MDKVTPFPKEEVIHCGCENEPAMIPVVRGSRIVCIYCPDCDYEMPVVQGQVIWPSGQ